MFHKKVTADHCERRKVFENVNMTIQVSRSQFLEPLRNRESKKLES